MVDKPNTNSYTDEELEQNEKIVIKYKLLREKIIESYQKGCRMLSIIKLVVTAAFIVFTAYAIVISEHTGNRMFWLVLWVLVIFANAFVFLLTDYCKYLVSEKVIPYLEDDNQLEFGEYSIFLEDEENEEEEEDE